jgi:hypothetical protein
MTLDFWRNVAVIWLCFQGFFILLIPLAIAYLMVRGMGWVLDKTAPLFVKAQGYSRQMRNKTEAVADKIAEPVIRARSKSSGMERVLERLFRPAPPAQATRGKLPVSTSGVTAVRTPPIPPVLRKERP